MTISSKISSDFNNKIALKVITGLNNFNIKQIKQMALASEIAKATYLDIAADINIVKELESISTIPICVSAVASKKLQKCQQAGVNIFEVGNYDCFYEEGRLFSSREILEISKKAKHLLQNTTLCVTVPHILEIEEQIKLAHDLQKIGIDIIQTEGKSSHFFKTGHLSGMIQKSASTFSSTYAISRKVNLPTISASGISSLTSPIAFLYGASGIGVGTNIKRLKKISSMIIYIYEIKTAIKCNNSIKYNIDHSIQSSKITRQLIFY
uniref:hypothetical protein n=1 Tax=Bangia atropurpurea TaxID=31347 RepID=UPI0007C5F30F|nr:hypothetical protein MW410_pgp194 [Bangia atropurpurea]UNJ18186.1 hypothetical protein [Bangia atropurpurea]